MASRDFMLTASDQAMAVGTLVKDLMGRWNADSLKGTAVTVEYSFGAKLPDYAIEKTDGGVSAVCPCCGGSLHAAGEEASGGYSDGYYRTAATSFQPFDAATRQQTRKALAAWSAVANIDFVEVADSEAVGMRFFSLSDPDAPFSAFAAGAGSAGWVGKGVLGDVWVNRAKASEGHKPLILLHEIGHTLGLKHPHDYPRMPAWKDSLQTTVMTYEDDYTYDIKLTVTPKAGGGFGWNADYVQLEESGHAHLGIFDVAAVQALYGARKNATDDTYRFSADPFTEMIYDGGGRDTIDLSNQEYESILDLTPGSFSSIGKRTAAQAIDLKLVDLPAYAHYGRASVYRWLFDRQEYLYLGENNLSIAYDTVIERAVGSKGNDKIVGNSADNWIKGGLGDDTLLGGDGVDTAYFNGKYSQYKIKVEKDSLHLSGPDGRDVLIGFEKLEFGDGKIVDVNTMTTTPASTLPVYRFYNTKTGTHFYTMDREERDSIQKNLPNYTYEGVAFKADKGKAADAAVYRFYNQKTGAHFFTANAAEYIAVRKLDGFSDEGIAYYAHSTAGEGYHPLHRFYNQKTGVHFYTADETERALVTKLVGFKYEGVACYVED